MGIISRMRQRFGSGENTAASESASARCCLAWRLGDRRGGCSISTPWPPPGEAGLAGTEVVIKEPRHSNEHRLLLPPAQLQNRKALSQKEVIKLPPPSKYSPDQPRLQLNLNSCRAGGCQRVDHRSAASVSPGNLSEQQILTSTPDL